MSTIRKNSYMSEVYQYGTTCAEHCSPATFTLEINGVLIPLCQTCLDELNEKVKSLATGNNTAENNTATTNLDELREDMKTALKIINSDIGMKNSILAQCDTENPDTKESVDSMRRSIADGERLLTKYADGRLDYETGGEKSGKLTSEIEREREEESAKDTEVPEIPPALDVCPKCGADAAVFVHPAFDGGSYVRCNKCMYSDQAVTWAPTDAQAAQKWNNFCEKGKAK